MSLRGLFVVVVILLVPCVGWSAAPPPMRVDALGDPLPRGALARLGTMRFRQSDCPDAVAISPDGTLAAAASNSSEIYLWELPSGELRGMLHGHRGKVTSLAFSPD